MIKDGDWKLIDYDPHSGRSVWKLEHGDGNFTIRTDEPHDALLKQNAEMRNETAGEKYGEWRLIANMPGDYWFHHLSEAAKQRDSKYIQKFLNDNPAWKTFR